MRYFILGILLFSTGSNALRFLTLSNASASFDAVSCDEIDFIIIFPGFESETLPCENAGTFSMDPNFSFPNMLHAGSPLFTTAFGSDFSLIFVNKGALGPETSIPIFRPDPNRWRILFWNGPFSAQDAQVASESWGIDSFIGINETEGDLKQVALICNEPLCIYKLHERRLMVSVPSGQNLAAVEFQRTVHLSPKACSPDNVAFIAPPVPLLSATMSIERVLGMQFCMVGIDSNIAKFEYPIEWLQATLQEEPCRKSEWVILTLFNGDIDPDVVDLIDNYAIVDIVFSDRDIHNMKSVVWVNAHGKLNVEFDSLTAKQSNSCRSLEVVSLTTSRKSERVTSTSLKFLSYTSVYNILVAVALAMLSGLGVNISFRKASRARDWQSSADTLT